MLYYNSKAGQNPTQIHLWLFAYNGVLFFDMVYVQVIWLIYCYITVVPAQIFIDQYTLLIEQLKPLEVAEAMKLSNLLTEFDYKVILDAPIDLIRSCYILTHVQCMETPKMFDFLDVLKEIPNQDHLYNTFIGGEEVNSFHQISVAIYNSCNNFYNICLHVSFQINS